MQPFVTKLLLFASACLVLYACSDEATPGDGDTATNDTAADVGDTGPSVACGDPSAAGSFEVTREAWAPDDPQRGSTLDALIWYPSADGAPDPAGAPYPLVTLSHGFLMAPDVYDVVARRIASHGFVVVGTKHVDTAERVVDAIVETCESIPQSEQLARVSELYEAMFEPDHALRRPVDLTTMIDAMAARSAPGGDLEGLVDTDHVGAVGHSFGGYTSFMASGAVLDTDLIAETCEGGPQIADLLSGQTLRFLICSLFSTTTPEALEGPVDARDDRIEAMVSLAGPVELMWGDAFEGLGALPVPVLLVYTDTDEAVEYTPGPVAAYGTFPSPKYFLTLYGGNHGNFGTINFDLFQGYVDMVPEDCMYRSFVSGFVGDPEAVPDLDPAVQAELSAVAAAAFLQKHVRGATGCDDYLAPAFFDSVGGELQTFVSD